MMTIDVPVPVGLLIIAAGLFLVWKIYQRKIMAINNMPDVPAEIPPGGHQVPVLATFRRVGGKLRYSSRSYNSLYPALTLFEDRIESMIVFKREVRLPDIRETDITDTFLTRNLVIVVDGKQETYTANLYSRRNLCQVLDYLQRREVRLSQRARDFLTKHAKD